MGSTGQGLAMLLAALAIGSSGACRSAEQLDAGTEADTLGAAYLLASSGCRFVRAHRFTDPEALAREYVQRGTEAQYLYLGDSVVGQPFESWIAWADSAFLCAGQMPGYRRVPCDLRVITGYTLGRLEWSGATAVVPVIYEAAGELDQTGFHPEPRSETVNVLLRRTFWGWRVDRPDPLQRLNISILAGRLHLSPDTQAQLRLFCQQRPELRCDL
jgi:hypothetical protein